jgi:hypothetical protein
MGGATRMYNVDYFQSLQLNPILGQALDYLSQGVLSKLIWAENNSDGKGATFSFTLPLSL